jgi:hypothetical protein
MQTWDASQPHIFISSNISSIFFIAFFHRTCCSTVRHLRAARSRGFWRMLRLQIGFEYVEVIVKPFNVLLPDGADALQHFINIEGGFRVCERIRGSGGGLAVNEGEGIGGHKKPLGRNGFMQSQKVRLQRSGLHGP